MPENLSDLPHLTDEEREWVGLCEKVKGGKKWIHSLQYSTFRFILNENNSIIAAGSPDKTTEEDFSFIAASRTALPALLHTASMHRSLIRDLQEQQTALRAENERLRAALRPYVAGCPCCKGAGIAMRTTDGTDRIEIPCEACLNGRDALNTEEHDNA